MAKRLVPLLDRVLVERIKKEAKTAAGILLPENPSKINEAKVVAVGPGRRTSDGSLIPLTLKVSPEQDKAAREESA